MEVESPGILIFNESNSETIQFHGWSMSEDDLEERTVEKFIICVLDYIRERAIKEIREGKSKFENCNGFVGTDVVVEQSDINIGRIEMITGGCPYCNCDIINYMPDNPPCFGKSTCDECGEQYWMYYSRIKPKAYTRDEFSEKFVVDEETKSIIHTGEYQKKIDNSEIFWESNFGKLISKKIDSDIMNSILCGEPDES